MNTIRQLILLSFGRLTPTVLPYSLGWLWLLIGLNFLNHLSFFWAHASFIKATGLSSLSLGAEGALLFLLLWTRGQQHRFIKLAIALLGTHIVLSTLFQLILSLPWGSFLPGLMFFCSIWALAVNSRIFQEGLAVSKLKAVLIAIGFECLATLIIMPYLGGVLG